MACPLNASHRDMQRRLNLVMECLPVSACVRLASVAVQEILPATIQKRSETLQSLQRALMEPAKVWEVTLHTLRPSVVCDAFGMAARHGRRVCVLCVVCFVFVLCVAVGGGFGDAEAGVSPHPAGH